MKTEVEINGFEITIQDIEGKVSVKVEMNDEVVEELTLDPAEYGDNSNDDEDEEIRAFGDNEEEEEMEGDDNNEEAEETEEENEESDEMMGESIKSFGDMFPDKKKKK